MSLFFNCVAYDDVNTVVRFDDHIVFLDLEVKEKDNDIHLTLNLFQTQILAKNLSLALSKINFANLKESKYFGDLSVKVEVDNLPKLNSSDNLYDNELMYVKEDNSVAVPF